MIQAARHVALALLVAFIGLISQPARASAAYQGTYVIIDPYNISNVAMLTSASAVSCAGGQAASLLSPFCGPTNGILLRIGWCSFELFHQTAPDGGAYPSCHYQVGFSAGAGSAGEQIFQTDRISPCTGTYDICNGGHQSVLGSALALIVSINAMRAQGGLPPLNLAVGLAAGVWTPQTVLNAVGFVDVPDETNTGLIGQNQCVRLPLVWPQTYTTDYDDALQSLLTYIRNHFSGSPNITILKVSGISADDLELEVPGRAQSLQAPADPGPAGPGPLLSCSSTTPGAQTWLNAYTKAPNGSKTFSQANEWAFGTIVGFETAELANLGLSNVLLSIPTTGASGFADVDCGTAGATACAVSSNSGNWPIYYLELYVDDLFNGGLAFKAANAAYQGIHAGHFGLPPSGLSVNWTGLSVGAIVPSQQVGCTLNNTNPTNAPTQKLNGQPVQILGAGTTLGWQTQAQSGLLCATGQYQTIMNNGIANGGLFLEVETDAAFTDLALCSGYLSTALQQILALSPPTQCDYQ
jgi:hypothetical protein